MTDDGYLVLNRRGIVKLAKRIPSLRSGEIMVKLRVTFDAQLFDPAQVNLNITREHVMEAALELGNRVPRVGVQYVPGLDDIDDDPRLNEFVRDVERVVRGQ